MTAYHRVRFWCRGDIPQQVLSIGGIRPQAHPLSQHSLGLYDFFFFSASLKSFKSQIITFTPFWYTLIQAHVLLSKA